MIRVMTFSFNQVTLGLYRHYDYLFLRVSDGVRFKQFPHLSTLEEGLREFESMKNILAAGFNPIK